MKYIRPSTIAKTILLILMIATILIIISTVSKGQGIKVQETLSPKDTKIEHDYPAGYTFRTKDSCTAILLEWVNKKVEWKVYYKPDKGKPYYGFTTSWWIEYHQSEVFPSVKIASLRYLKQIRYPGLTFFVNDKETHTITRYWFARGIEDSDIEPKK